MTQCTRTFLKILVLEKENSTETALMQFTVEQVAL